MAKMIEEDAITREEWMALYDEVSWPSANQVAQFMYSREQTASER